MNEADLDRIRKRRDEYYEAQARVMRAREPGSDRADNWPAARESLFAAAVLLADEAPDLINQIGRERAALDDALALAREQAAEIERLREEIAALATASVDRAQAKGHR